MVNTTKVTTTIDFARNFVADAAGSSLGNYFGTAIGYDATFGDDEIVLDVLESLSLALLFA